MSDFSCCLNHCNCSCPILSKIQSLPCDRHYWMRDSHTYLYLYIFLTETCTFRGWILKNNEERSRSGDIFSSFCVRIYFLPSIHWHYNMMLRRWKWRYLTKFINKAQFVKDKKLCASVGGIRMVKRFQQIQHCSVFILRPCRPHITASMKSYQYVFPVQCQWWLFESWNWGTYQELEEWKGVSSAHLCRSSRHRRWNHANQRLPLIPS